MRGLMVLVALWSFGCATTASPIAPGVLTGRYHAETSPPFSPAWRHDFKPPSILPGPSFEVASPVYHHGSGCLFVGTSEPGFFCYDAQNGVPIWEAKLPEGVNGRPVAAGDNVVVGTDGGRLVAFSIKDGEERWSYQVKGVVTRAPVLVGDLLLVVDGTNTVYALEAETGRWRWQYGREQPGAFAVFGEARPLHWEGMVFFGTSDGHMTALRAEDGTEVWSVPLGVRGAQFLDVDADPVVIDGHLYGASVSGGFFQLDPRTGRITWRSKLTGIVTMAPHDGDLILSLDSPELARFDTYTKRFVWRRGFPKAYGEPGQIVIAGDLGGAALSKGPVYLFNVNTGTDLVSFHPGSGFLASPELTETGAFFVLSNRGVLYGFRP